MYLARKPVSEQTGRERLLSKKFAKQEIDYFPVNHAICLPTGDADGDSVFDQVARNVTELKSDIEDLSVRLSTLDAFLSSMDEKMNKFLKNAVLDVGDDGDAANDTDGDGDDGDGGDIADGYEGKDRADVVTGKSKMRSRVMRKARNNKRAKNIGMTASNTARPIETPRK